MVERAELVTGPELSLGHRSSGGTGKLVRSSVVGGGTGLVCYFGVVVDLIRSGVVAVVGRLLLGLFRDLVRGLSLAQSLAEAALAGADHLREGAVEGATVDAKRLEGGSGVD